MAEIITLKTLLWIGAGSFLPALFWLWFWLKEDKKKPEPSGLLALSFIAGTITVFVVFPLEEFAYSYTSSGTLLIATLATIEEVVKYLAIYTVALRSKYFDEPIDAVIYAITVALGFSAMENFLYIINIFNESGAAISIMSGNLRFIGATLLHTVSSSAVGIAIAFSIYATRFKKLLYLLVGITTASVLHTAFNLSIINTTNVGEILTIFSYLWIFIIILILLLEKIKRIKIRRW